MVLPFVHLDRPTVNQSQPLLVTRALQKGQHAILRVVKRHWGSPLGLLVNLLWGKPATMLEGHSSNLLEKLMWRETEASSQPHPANQGLQDASVVVGVLAHRFPTDLAFVSPSYNFCHRAEMSCHHCVPVGLSTHNRAQYLS